jgi:hypothetical protein
MNAFSSVVTSPNLCVLVPVVLKPTRIGSRADPRNRASAGPILVPSAQPDWQREIQDALEKQQIAPLHRAFSAEGLAKLCSPGQVGARWASSKRGRNVDEPHGPMSIAALRDAILKGRERPPDHIMASGHRQVRHMACTGPHTAHQIILAIGRGPHRTCHSRKVTKPKTEEAETSPLRRTSPPAAMRSMRPSASHVARASIVGSLRGNHDDFRRIGRSIATSCTRHQKVRSGHVPPVRYRQKCRRS